MLGYNIYFRLLSAASVEHLMGGDPSTAISVGPTCAGVLRLYDPKEQACCPRSRWLQVGRSGVGRS